MRLRRTGDMNADIQDRRGQGGIPGGAAIGGGVGGLATIIIALLLGTGQCSSGGGLGNAGFPSGFDQGDVGAGGAPGVTCDTETAKLLCDATTSVQDFWTDEAPSALGVPYQRTQTVFYSGATQTGCGPASSQTGPFYCPADQLVYFDLDFLNQLQSQFGAGGDFATAYITAHEYGHHIQNLIGLSRQVTRPLPTAAEPGQPAVHPPRAPGRLLRRRLGRQRAGPARPGRPRGGPAGGRRRR